MTGEKLSLDFLPDVVAQVWRQFLDLDVSLSSPSALGFPLVSASVRLDGAFSGFLVLFCPVRLAQLLAQAAAPSEVLVPSSSLDATAEIANMLAGSSRLHLPAPSYQQVPLAVILRNPADPGGLQTFGGRVYTSAWFESLGEVFSLALIEDFPLLRKDLVTAP